jgi:predicted Rossmann-fold nucleotide-binding protein
VAVESFLQLDNVDGSRRKILIIKHSDGVIIRAGCFLGTAEEFLERAEREGKDRYVSVVGAVIDALSREETK